jgi:copper chaperone
MSESIYTVRGMTCDHCVSSVRAEVTTVLGVTEVDVDLATGQVRVVSNQPPDDGAVRVAVEEAGYEVVS